MSSSNFKIHKIPTRKINYRTLELLRKTEISRGLWTEERFLNAIKNSNGNTPAWFKDISKSTKEDDQRGIDFIVQTTSGNIFIQIKSSEYGARKFIRNKKKNLRILVLVIKTNYHEEEIRSLSFSAMQEEVNFLKKPFCS